MEFVQHVHILAIKLHENGLKQIIISTRPKQGTKNVILFAAHLHNLGSMDDDEMIEKIELDVNHDQSHYLDLPIICRDS